MKSADKKKDVITKKLELVNKSSSPKKTSAKNKSSSKPSTGINVRKVKDQPKEEAPSPSNDDIRNSIRKIFTQVDFNTATFTDIIKLLAQHFNTDLTHREVDIRDMIQQELSKLAESDDDEEDDAAKDEKNPSSVGVEA